MSDARVGRAERVDGVRGIYGVDMGGIAVEVINEWQVEGRHQTTIDRRGGSRAGGQEAPA